MKTKLLLLCACIMLFAGCKTNYPVAQETGKADVAYLLFVRTNNGPKNVTVSMTDPNITFDAQTVKIKKSNRKGYQYQVSTGTRTIVVKDKENGKVLYQSKVFLQGQQVKEIEL